MYWFSNLHADGNDGGDGDDVDIADDGEPGGGDSDCDGLKGKWNYATGQKLQFSSETL